MIFDPRCSETQFFGQLIKQLSKERSVFVFTFHNQRRRFPLEALPDRFNRVELWRSDRKVDQTDPKFVGTLARVLAHVRGEIYLTRADLLFRLIYRKRQHALTVQRVEPGRWCVDLHQRPGNVRVINRVHSLGIIPRLRM